MQRRPGVPRVAFTGFKGRELAMHDTNTRWRCAMVRAARTLATFLVLAAPTVAHAQQEFTGLGTLPGGISSMAFGISADGTAVVGAADADDHHIHAFRWTAQ